MPSVRTKAQYLGSATFGLPEPVIPTDRGAVTDARIPPGSEIAFRFGLNDAKTRLRFRYFLEEADISGDKSSWQVKIVNRDADTGSWIERLTLFVIANYLACLVFIMVVLLLFILIYLVAGLVALLRPPKESRPAEPKATLQLTLNGENYVATVERS